MKIIDLNASPGTKPEENNNLNLTVFTAILFYFDCHSVNAASELVSWPLLSVFNRAFKMYEFVVYCVVGFMLGNSYPLPRR